MKKPSKKSPAVLPKKLQALLWSKKINKINLEKDSSYIIHNILAYGTIDDLKWLFKNYSKQKLIKQFIKHPLKIYTKPGFKFTTNIILKITKTPSSRSYVKTVF